MQIKKLKSDSKEDLEEVVELYQMFGWKLIEIRPAKWYEFGAKYVAYLTR